MANIISFEGQNIIYTGEGCLDLPALKTFDQHGRDLIACCYQLTPFERAELRRSGVLYHQLWTHKPQRDWLTSMNPFNLLVEIKAGSFVVLPGDPYPLQIVPTSDAAGNCLTMLLWQLEKREINTILENDGMAFSYLWAKNPQPQYVTSLNPWAAWPNDPDQV